MLEEEPNGVEPMFPDRPLTCKRVVVRFCEECYQKFKMMESLARLVANRSRRNVI